MSNLFVGFSKADITPKMGNIALGGYGATQHRIASKIIHPLECMVTAIKQDDLTMLFVNPDFINIHAVNCKRWRNCISERTNIPEDRIIISGTHTHSGPAFEGTGNIDAYLDQIDEQLPEIAARALADMQPAKISYGKINVGSENIRFNFVRHYTMTDIEFAEHPEDGPVYYVGDNSGIQYSRDPKHYCYTGHVWDADPELQVVRFSREGLDDIVWVNFQAHATITGATAQYNMSSDYPYTMRKRLEAIVPGIQSVFIQGAAGNINPVSRFSWEGIPGVTYYVEKERPLNDADAYGSILGLYAKHALDKAIPGNENGFSFEKCLFTLECDHHEEHRLQDAKNIVSVFEAEGRTQKVMDMCFDQGFNSPYHCCAIINKSKLPETKDVEINAIRIGNIGMITAPFELFDKTGVRIKTKSPFDQTIIQGYSCDGIAYLPCKEAPENCYERNISRFMPGSAEILESKFISMLESLKGNS